MNVDGCQEHLLQRFEQIRIAVSQEPFHTNLIPAGQPKTFWPQRSVVVCSGFGGVDVLILAKWPWLHIRFIVI